MTATVAAPDGSPPWAADGCRSGWLQAHRREGRASMCDGDGDGGDDDGDGDGDGYGGDGDDGDNDDGDGDDGDGGANR